MSNKVRLQKYLSNQGLCSRRKAEEFILKGYVRLNGNVVTTLGTTCDPVNDHVELSTEAKAILSKFSYIKYYKPKGIVTHSAQEGEKEIADIFNYLLKKY